MSQATETLEPLPSPSPTRTRLGVFILFGVLAVGGTAAFGIAPRQRQHDALADAQRDLGGPRIVRVATVVAGAPKSELTVPGTTMPFRSTQIYAKSNGFLRKNLVEVGDHVKAGQLMAEIDAPETDQDVRLAEARLDEAEANVTIVQSTAERNKSMATVGVVSQQAADDTRAQANSAVAALKSRKAELSRLRSIRGYQTLVAPFDGVVTKRNVDPGTLVGPSVAIFEVAQIDPMRVFVDVPQLLAKGVAPGLDAHVFLPAQPANMVAGKVVRTSTVLDQATRTLHTEVQIPTEGPILPGAFVYVKLAVPRTDAPPTVSANALIVRKEGTMVARLEGDHVKLVPVTVARDLGKEIELSSGVKAGDVVVVNASDDLADGAPVTLAPPPSPPEKRDGG